MPPDENTPANPPAGNGAGAGTGPTNPPAGNGVGTVNPPAGNSGQAGGDPNKPQLSIEELQEALRKERMGNELQRERLKRLDELEKAAKAADDAKLSEQEKLSKLAAEHQARADEMAAANQQLRLELGVLRVAGTLGITDPGLALVALASEHQHELAADPDSGAYTNIEKLLAQVLKDHPSLAAPAATPGQPGVLPGNARPAVTSGPGASPPRSQVQQQPQPRDLRTQPIRRLTDIEWKR